MKMLAVSMMLVVLKSSALAQQCDRRDEGTFLDEYVIELWNQVDTLQYLVELITANGFFQNSAGLCPERLASDRVPCSKTDGHCFCAGSAKVSWFRADAFCKFHGMDLISIDSDSVLSALRRFLANRTDLQDRQFWTSGRDPLPPGSWIWTATGKPVGSFQSADQRTEDTHCLKWSFKSGVEEANCIGEPITFICQQNFQQIVQ